MIRKINKAEYKELYQTISNSYRYNNKDKSFALLDIRTNQISEFIDKYKINNCQYYFLYIKSEINESSLNNDTIFYYRMNFNTLLVDLFILEDDYFLSSFYNSEFHLESYVIDGLDGLKVYFDQIKKKYL